MNIIAFGASVTKQDRAHSTGELRGYVPYLRTLLRKYDSEIELEAIGLGSSTFSTAGYCLLPEIIQMKPDLLIFEWHTTGEKIFDSDLLDSAFRQLRLACIFTLVVVLPKRDIADSGKELPSINQCMLKESELVRVFNLYPFVGKKINMITDLRDNVHTTSQGGETYAALIYEEILKYLPLRTISKDKLLSAQRDNIAVVPVNSCNTFSKYIRLKRLDIALHTTSTGKVTIIIEQQVGPFTPVATISLNGEVVGYSALWDQWCHYERECYKQVFSFESLSGNKSHLLSIAVSQEDPQYEICNKASSWPEASQRHLRFGRVFAIGHALPVLFSCDPYHQ